MPPAASSAFLTEVRREMSEHPGRFDFFQAVRLMLRIFNQREVPGGYAPQAAKPFASARITRSPFLPARSIPSTGIATCLP